MKPKRIAILGSTGSIGRQSLEFISSREDLCACALAAGSNWKLLAEQARRFGSGFVALADERTAGKLRNELPAGTELFSGPDAMAEMVRACRPDVLLSGVVGTAGVAPTLEAVRCGSTLAIANKETLVMGGAIVMPAARQAGVAVLPVDSEHSGIFQCLAAGRRRDVRRVVITASGGALRGWDADRIAGATVADALNHPTWQMGPKVTIDSATLINKAMELVEAHWLFDLPGEQIGVVLHDESIVHSYVEFCDGSVIAQLARPDMTTPIAYALCWPDRPQRDAPLLDLPAVGKLTFSPLQGRFARAVNLGYEAIRRGGRAGAVLNGANEAAVEAFLEGNIAFGQIVPLVEDIMNCHETIQEDITLESLISAGAWARQQLARRIGSANDKEKSKAQAK